ncbi:hypothetical protein SAMN05216198_0118 [Halopseudomonas litoralis]|uniref:Uncharacterized protein n=1 Tax=Halopseudomonas litoralis TaxID=797277 RepID=A0A1H1L6P9_9GAMM|nr:hypothetical protein SAMN05216198_0118 [Halopseudomonas litoralis]
MLLGMATLAPILMMYTTPKPALVMSPMNLKSVNPPRAWALGICFWLILVLTLMTLGQLALLKRLILFAVLVAVLLLIPVRVKRHAVR